MRAWAALVLAAACSQPAPAPQKPSPYSCEAIGGGAPSLCPPRPGKPDPAKVPPDEPPPSQEEKLAAIQHAMNQLDEAAQACWAAAATDRFDIEGELSVLIEIGSASAKATVVRDTARNARLATCLTNLLGGYRWAPPLHGDSIQLPFKFRAPDGQSVIDRRLVEWNGQQNLSIAVLLDEANTGNAAASMFEVALAAGATTGARTATRAELWYFLTPARASSASSLEAIQTGADSARYEGGVSVVPSIAAGDMVYVPAGAVRNVAPRGGELRAVVIVAPGGQEGTARAGALPTPAHTASAKAPPGPHFLPAAKATRFGPATIFLEPAIVKGAPFSASVLELAAGTSVPEHVHAKETELLYVLEGSGTMTIAGQPVAVTPTSVIQIPPDTKHAFTASSLVRAVQLYTPAGPEQRFKKKP